MLKSVLKLLINKRRIALTNKIKSEQENDLIKLDGDQYLGYFTKVIPTTVMTVHIDEPIKHPAYYRQIASGIDELSEGDELVFEIASPGGRMDGLEVLLSAIRRTDATTVANINGDCHSAASILALNCDVVSVSPYGSMLVHFVSYGSSGASNHVLKQAEHIKKVSEQLFRDTYKFFLTEEEMTKCIEDDYQLWLDSSQVLERLKIRAEMYQKLYAEQEDDYNCENCHGETCDSYQGCTASIDPAELQYNPDEVAFK